MCRIDENFVIKVGDFGLSEEVFKKDYFRERQDSGVKLPIKWMALESLNDYIFTEKTDVVRMCLLALPGCMSVCTHTHMPTVVVRSDVLGGVQCRQDSLSWLGPGHTCLPGGVWPQAPEAKQPRLQR